MKAFISNSKINNIVGITLLLLIWYIFSVIVSSSLLVPSPIVVIKNLLKFCQQVSFYIAVLTTVLRVITGFLLSLSLGILLGILAGRRKFLNDLLMPVVSILRSIPVIAFILLFLIWMKSGNVPIAIAVFTMFPILYTTIRDGIKLTHNEYIELAKVYRLTRMQRIRHIYFPSMLPVGFNGISNALGFGWRAVITGEVLSLPLSGIGVAMHEAQLYLLVSEVVAWTFMAVMLGFIAEIFLEKIKKYILAKYYEPGN